MKKIISGILMLLIFFIYSPGYAEDEKNTDKSAIDLFWSLGTKGVYSSGMSDSYTYNRSDVKGGFKSEYIDLSAYIRRYFNYQITDGNGIYEYRSFNEAGLSLDAYIYSMLNLSGEYSRADDFNDLKRDIYYGSVELVFTRVILSADYSYEDFEYKMDFNIINTEKKDYSFTIEYAFTDSFSADISYKYSNTYFNSLGYNYYKNIFRAGFTINPADYLFILGGASGGKDSEEYIVYGADLGATLLIYSRFKVYFIYSFNYYDPAQTDSASVSGGGGSGHGSGGTNPYLTSDQIGEPYFSHVLSFGMSVTF